MRRNDEVEAQRRRWTFYETIINGSSPIQLGTQTCFLVARARGQAAKTKTAGRQPSFYYPPSFPQRDAEGKGGLSNKARKPASGKRGIAAFFGEPNALCPGMGPLCYTCNPLFSEPTENTPISEREMLFCSIKSEMISINRPPRETCPPPGIFPPSDTSWVKTSPLPEFRHRFR